MNIYKIYQTVNKNYDTYDSAVVIAEDEEQARNIHPASLKPYYWEEDKNKDCFIHWGEPYPNSEWSGNGFYNPKECWVGKKEDVKSELIGKAKENTKVGVIVASYNSG